MPPRVLILKTNIKNIKTFHLIGIAFVALAGIRVRITLHVRVARERELPKP